MRDGTMRPSWIAFGSRAPGPYRLHSYQAPGIMNPLRSKISKLDFVPRERFLQVGWNISGTTIWTGS